nr:hypothetical protein [Tanacetum cinerariifolium]
MSSPNSERRKLYDFADLAISSSQISECHKLYDFADLALSSEMKISNDIQQPNSTGTNTSTFFEKSSPLTSKVPNKDANSNMSKKKAILPEGYVVQPKYHKFSITLSKEEIEEDLLAITGKRPRRFSKRVDTRVKTNIDELHPGGSSLDGHTAETLLAAIIR